MSSHFTHCTHIFVQKDTVLRTLQQPYHDPHKVVERGAKTFTVDVNGKQEVILLDHLKPAHIEDLAPVDVTVTYDTVLPPSPAVPTPPATTRTTWSGQHVHWPDQYIL